MSIAAFGLGVHVLALALMAGAAACAVGAALSRSLAAACLQLTACSALAAAGLTALGAGAPALGVALIGVGVGPVLVLATLLLSTRAAKPRRRGVPWLAVAGAAASVSALVWAVFRSGAVETPNSAASVNVSAWMAALVFAAIVAALGLLGFGERGAFERERRS